VPSTGRASLASAEADQIVDWIAPTLQRYLTGKLD
jgi:hypothetical protein